MMEWHEDIEFWELLGPLMFNKDRWEEAALDIPNMEDLLDLQAGVRILDMACGTGRYALPLARAGFEVTAVDPIGTYLEEGRKMAGKESLDIEFIRGDMRTFSREQAFDAVVIMGTSFGIFRSEDEERISVTNMTNSLVEGGRILLETVGEGTGRGTRPNSYEYSAEGLVCTETHRPRGDGIWVDSHLKVVHDAGVNEYSYSYRVYTPDTFSDLLRTCGLKDVHCFSDLTGIPYTPSSEKMFVVARKADE
jgi:SAM-dependent methyltransferase